MPRTRSGYSPQIQRFLVCALYHEAKTKRIPMTVLTDQLLSEKLKDSDGWKKAQEAGHTFELNEK